MSYKCCECGHIFEECEIAEWEDQVGEFWGRPYYESMYGCPLCRGEFAETVKCAICGSEHLKEELNAGVCDECLDKYRKDFDLCYKLAGSEKWNVKINMLLATLFKPAEIEQILIDYIKNSENPIDCSQFIEDDISWFAEKLIKEVNEDENG